MNRSFSRWLTAAVLVPLLGVGALRAEDEPRAPPAVPLAQIATDPIGKATQLAQAAARALAAEKPGVALEAWVALVQHHPHVPVSLQDAGLRREDAGARGLYWPAARVVNHLVARQDAAQQQRWNQALRAGTEPLLARLRRGDAGARRELADRFGATTAGRSALLLDAEILAERGAWRAAAARFRTWLDLAPAGTPPARRARIVRRLAEMLDAMQDAGGMQALIARHAPILTEPCTPDGRSLRDHIARLETARAQRRAASPVRVAPALPTPVLVWSQPLDEPHWQLAPGGAPTDIVRAGAWTDGDRWIIVHDGRVVRALDFATGVERWRFPRTAPAPLHHPAERYPHWARPTRVVVADGASVLVVLGDMPASGSYTFHGERVDALGQARVCRTRLAALELETGRLQWATGLATETDPLLGDPTSGCISAPLVEDGRVYALFGRLTGKEIHVACLDRATGTPQWTQLLGSGESGRRPSRAAQPRLQSRYVDALPWGARPSLQDGELCVMTHAGMAAGLDAKTGRLSWLRALPRFEAEPDRPSGWIPADEGHAPRNAPLAFGDAWILAPADCPQLLSLVRGSGALRWSRPAFDPERGSRWRHLLGVGPDADGHPRLRLSGSQPSLVDPIGGEEMKDPAHLAWERDWNLMRVPEVGRPWSDGESVMVARGGNLQIAPWVPDHATGAEVQTLVPLEGAGAPRGGTVLRTAGHVVVVGARRIGLFDVGGNTDERLRALTDPVADVVARAMRAVKRRDPPALDAIVEAYNALLAPEARAAATRLADVLIASLHDGEEPPAASWIEAVGRFGAGLPAVIHARLRREQLVALENAGAPRVAFEVARTWLESGDRALVETEGRDGISGRAWMRGDLFAARALRDLHTRYEALAEAEQARNAHWDAVLSRADGNPRMLQWVTERGRGTAAAREALDELAKMSWKRRQWSEAAAWLAEQRATAADTPDTASRAALARQQLDEALAWGRAGHEIEARNLATALVRWVPDGARSTEGASLRAVRTELQRRFAWHPERGGETLDVWPGQEPTKDEVRSVEWMALAGPGAAHWNGLALLVRGFDPEIWSLQTGERVATFAADQGWFGGTFHSVDEWVPGGGVLVASVVAGEPADRAKLKTHDWLRSWDGEPCRTLDVFLRQIARARPGHPVAVDVRRNGARVLSTFRPGVRPAKHGRALTYTPIWVGPDGRALFPTRTGLVSLTPRPPELAPFWTWSGDGIVRRCDVIGDAAYLIVGSRLHDDTLVAVDTKTGRERWRTRLAGRAIRVEGTGSGVVVHANEPKQVAVLDRWDGSVRARHRLFEPHHQEFPRHLNDRDLAASAVGRVAMVLGDRDTRLALLDVSSGAVVWQGERNRYLGQYLRPHVSMGAFLASIHSSTEIRIVVPDPLDAPRVLRLDKKALLTEQRHHGRVGNDTRLTVRGRRLFLERIPGGGSQPVRPGVFELDERALASRPSGTDPQRAGGAITYRTDMPLLGGDRADDRYIVDSVATFDGLLILAGRIGAEDQVEAAWVHAEPIRGTNLLGETNGSLSLHTDLALEVSRHAPRRSGNVLFVPTDRGARVIPVRTAR